MREPDPVDEGGTVGWVTESTADVMAFGLFVVCGLVAWGLTGGTKSS
jgi:hypothetical protein